MRVRSSAGTRLLTCSNRCAARFVRIAAARSASCTNATRAELRNRGKRSIASRASSSRAKPLVVANRPASRRSPVWSPGEAMASTGIHPRVRLVTATRTQVMSSTVRARSTIATIRPCRSRFRSLACSAGPARSVASPASTTYARRQFADVAVASPAVRHTLAQTRTIRSAIATVAPGAPPFGRTSRVVDTFDTPHDRDRQRKVAWRDVESYRL